MTVEGHSCTQTRITEHNSYASYGVSLRKQVCKLLDENPLLSPRKLADLICDSKAEALKFYKEHRQVLTNYRNFWKYNHENERGSKCSNLHCFKAKVRLDRAFSQALRRIVELDVEKGFFVYGWVCSGARNRFLIWRGRLGRVVWFETGTVTLHVKKPGNLGKAKQLFCDAFGNTGLLTDVQVLVRYADKIWQKGLHAPYASSSRLPKMEIKDFVDSHGILIKSGDRSHPNAIEVIAEFPSYAEKLIETVEKKEFEILELRSQVKELVGLLKNPEAQPATKPGDAGRAYTV